MTFRLDRTTVAHNLRLARNVDSLEELLGRGLLLKQFRGDGRDHMRVH